MKEKESKKEEILSRFKDFHIQQIALKQNGPGFFGCFGGQFFNKNENHFGCWYIPIKDSTYERSLFEKWQRKAKKEQHMHRQTKVV